MNTPKLTSRKQTGVLRGDLRPSACSPRPIPCPETRPDSRYGGGR
jgi:hypothetical protein